MNSVVTIIDKDRIEMNGQVYKRMVGAYSPLYRRAYMRAWRKNRKDRNLIRKDISLILSGVQAPK
jgi:hypothetical protein